MLAGGRKTDAQTASMHTTMRDELQCFQEGKSCAVSCSFAHCLLSNYGREERFPGSAAPAEIKGNK